MCFLLKNIKKRTKPSAIDTGDAREADNLHKNRASSNVATTTDLLFIEALEDIAELESICQRGLVYGSEQEKVLLGVSKDVEELEKRCQHEIQDDDAGLNKTQSEEAENAQIKRKHVRFRLSLTTSSMAISPSSSSLDCTVRPQIPERRSSRQCLRHPSHQVEAQTHGVSINNRLQTFRAKSAALKSKLEDIKGRVEGSTAQGKDGETVMEDVWVLVAATT